MPFHSIQPATQPVTQSAVMNPAVFITCANLQSIIRKSQLDLRPDGEVWKRKILFFNGLEKGELIAIRHLLADPQRYFSEIYTPCVRRDSFRFVTPERSPAYHFSRDCPRLSSDFENYQIPEEIGNRGHAVVLKFREWFQTNVHLLEDREDLFRFRLRNEFQISEVPKYVKYENSGHEEHENLGLEKLETRINTLIKEAGRFYYACAKNTAILSMYSRCAFHGFKDEGLPSQVPGYAEDDVKAFLREYDDNFKQPLKRDLIEYYRRDLNPDIRMSDSILDQLGFKPCGSCSSIHQFRG